MCVASYYLAMCNKYPNRKAPDAMFEPFSQLKMPLVWADGAIPNDALSDEVSIRDRAPIVRRVGEGVEASMTTWAWPAPNGKPVFNFRSEGRSFAKSERCLIPADGFFEFTDREDGKKSPKHRHLFTLADSEWLWIAGIVKEGCFTMLTVEPGPDVAPYHNRQIVVLAPTDGMAWLDLKRSEAEILKPAPAGTLKHERLS
jgi:putative SOS response-associated peptidase YedK